MHWFQCDLNSFVCIIDEHRHISDFPFPFATDVSVGVPRHSDSSQADSSGDLEFR
jgi:hypothetical protein